MGCIVINFRTRERIEVSEENGPKVNPEEETLKQAFRDSLDNEKVKKRYKINAPTEDERRQKIKKSVERINKVISELE